MSGQYERWLGDPDARQILEGHNAHKLAADQQVAFEELVRGSDRLGKKLPPGRHQALIRKLIPPVRNRSDAGFLVASFKAAIRDREIWSSGGQDPHVFAREAGHRRGSDRS